MYRKKDESYRIAEAFCALIEAYPNKPVAKLLEELITDPKLTSDGRFVRLINRKLAKTKE